MDYHITINMDKRDSEGKPTVSHTSDTVETPPVTVHLELIEKGVTFELGSFRILTENADSKKFSIGK